MYTTKTLPNMMGALPVFIGRLLPFGNNPAKNLLYLLALLLPMGCSDFLKEESQDEVIVRTVRDYGELLLGEGYPEPNSTIFSCLFVFDDDLQIDDAILANTDDFTLIANFGCFTWQPDMWDKQEKMTENYSASYKRIMGCNAVLDGIDNAIGDKAGRERVKAEALAVRAYFYLQLVNLYGKPYNADKLSPGVPLKLHAGIMENGIARSTVAEVYSQIIGDLETASSLLEKQPKKKGDFRINYAAVNILLSRAYLYMEQWKEAVKAAERVIKSGGALTDYTRISDPEKFYFTGYEHSEVEWIYGANNRSEGLTSMIPSTDLLSKFKKGDLRRTLYFGKNEDGTLIVKKQRSKNTKSPLNVLRTSEAYLNRAEALAADNRAAEALSDLNTLRRHRIAKYTGVNIADAAKLMEEIRLERRKELCFEEVRWFDLRRYGMPSLSHRFKSKKQDAWKTYTLKEKDPLYTLPIPNEAIKRNPHPKMEQNKCRKEPMRPGM